MDEVNIDDNIDEALWRQADKWARTYKQCISCCTRAFAHAGNGLCKRGYYKTNACPACGEQIHKSSVYCSSCAAKERMNILRDVENL